MFLAVAVYHLMKFQRNQLKAELGHKVKRPRNLQRALSLVGD